MAAQPPDPEQSEAHEPLEPATHPLQDGAADGEVSEETRTDHLLMCAIPWSFFFWWENAHSHQGCEAFMFPDVPTSDLGSLIADCRLRFAGHHRLMMQTLSPLPRFPRRQRTPGQTGVMSVMCFLTPVASKEMSSDITIK